MPLRTCAWAVRRMPRHDSRASEASAKKRATGASEKKARFCGRSGQANDFGGAIKKNEREEGSERKDKAREMVESQDQF